MCIRLLSNEFYRVMAETRNEYTCGNKEVATLNAVSLCRPFRGVRLRILLELVFQFCARSIVTRVIANDVCC